MASAHPPAGIYIHVPFCRCKCRYCDFYSIIDLRMMVNYTETLQQEMALNASSAWQADSLYFGGGTPSLLSYRQIGRLVEGANTHLGLSSDAEITLEINPATATADDLRAFAGTGVNRLNIGVQSFGDRSLAFLGRIHTSKQALQSYREARQAGFDNIGLDLIYGLPDQTNTQWKKDLEQAIHLTPEHLSCYMLSYEADTPLFMDRQAGRVTALSDLRTADLFCITHDLLADAGYEHYEISNFAKSGRRSLHNQKYWNFAAYLGLGPSAHGFRQACRWWNHRSLDRWLVDVNKGQLPRSGQEHLTDEQQLMEALYLGLRQSDGIDLGSFRHRFAIDFTSHFSTLLDRYAADDWLSLDAGRCRLSMKGMLFLDRIVGQLVEMLP